LQLNFRKKSNGEYVKEVNKFSDSSTEFRKYSPNSVINFSDQIYSLMSSYSENNAEYRNLWLLFKPLNRYRNQTDFIQGSVMNILKKKLLEQETIKEAYSIYIEILKFIEIILNLKVI